MIQALPCGCSPGEGRLCSEARRLLRECERESSWMTNKVDAWPFPRDQQLWLNYTRHFGDQLPVMLREEKVMKFVPATVRLEEAQIKLAIKEYVETRGYKAGEVVIAVSTGQRDQENYWASVVVEPKDVPIQAKSSRNPKD